MQDVDIQFLENSFKKYYFDHFDLIKVPERTFEREFGYQKFNSGMNRHITIKNDKNYIYYLYKILLLMFIALMHTIHFLIYL